MGKPLIIAHALRQSDGVSGANVGSVKFYDGTGTSDELLINIDTPAGTGNAFWMMIPGEGVLFRTGVLS